MEEHMKLMVNMLKERINNNLQIIKKKRGDCSKNYVTPRI